MWLTGTNCHSGNKKQSGQGANTRTDCPRPGAPWMILLTTVRLSKVLDTASFHSNWASGFQVLDRLGECGSPLWVDPGEMGLEFSHNGQG